jgi:DNA sulfur modification protein DndB
MKVQFPAMRARLGNREYFATTVALGDIPHFFKFHDWAQFEPSQRAQRVLNTARVPEITKYIVDNEDGYIFSSITACYNCPLKFTPSDLDVNMGIIEMNLEEMEFIINDGQHRAAAIAAALTENPALKKERISVLLFQMENLERLQQMFTDLNRYAHKTSKSLDILYDHRDHLSALTMEVAENIPAFRGQIDKERISLPASSPKLLTLSALYDANVELLGDVTDRPRSPGFADKVKQATQYWMTVADAIPDWQRVSKGVLSASELRKERINTHSVVLRALGGIGNTVFTAYPREWRTYVQRLADIDWRKSVGASVNPLWDNVCIVAGSVVSNRQARIAVLAVLKRQLDLPLSIQEVNVLNSLERKGSVYPGPGNGMASRALSQPPILQEIPYAPAEIFKETESPVTTSISSSPIFSLQLPGRFGCAEAREVNKEFIVLKDSPAKKDHQPSLPPNDIAYREELCQEGKLLLNEQDSMLIFTENVSFSSPSAAASIIRGTSTNGRKEWKVKGTEQTYGEWQNRSKRR